MRNITGVVEGETKVVDNLTGKEYIVLEILSTQFTAKPVGYEGDSITFLFHAECSLA